MRHLKDRTPLLLALAALMALSVCISPTPARADALKKTDNGPPFAFLCLRSERLPDSEELGRQLNKWLKTTDDTAVSELKIDRHSALTVSFQFEGHSFVAGLIDKPIPKPDLDYACGNSFFWPNAAEALSDHSSHLIVTALGDYDQPWQRAMRLSQVMAACIESFDSVGVYWGHASVVHTPEFFLQGMREAEPNVNHLPVELWTGFLRTERDDRTVDMYTDGLDVFGCMEFEIVESNLPMPELFEMLISMSRYVIFHGNVIGDGDTVGSNAEEKIVTHFTRSVIGRKAEVIRLNY